MCTRGQSYHWYGPGVEIFAEYIVEIEATCKKVLARYQGCKGKSLTKKGSKILVTYSILEDLAV
jgi:hypothetical protein